MESVAGVYSYFPQGSTILILFPDGRASISMREDATRISFFEKLASQSDEAPDEREQFSLEELEAEYGVEIERVLEDPSSIVDPMSEKLGIEEIVGRWELLANGQMSLEIENPFGSIEQSLLPKFDSGFFNVRVINQDVLLVPVGTSTPKINELRLDVWMRSPVSQRRFITIARWVIAESERFLKAHPELRKP
ncbi:MAG: hypothetical protein GY747_08740 [Planctomycetes bacterium]|nr:hypothetical protein [Planctomycetota bacterium]